MTLLPVTLAVLTVAAALTAASLVRLAAAAVALQRRPTPAPGNVADGAAGVHASLDELRGRLLARPEG